MAVVFAKNRCFFHMLSAYFAIRLFKILLICCFLKVSSSDFGCNRVMMNDWMQNSSRDLNKTFLLKNKSANFSFYLRKKSFQLYTNSLLHVPSRFESTTLGVVVTNSKQDLGLPPLKFHRNYIEISQKILYFPWEKHKNGEKIRLPKGP